MLILMVRLFHFSKKFFYLNANLLPTAEDNPANDYPDDELSSADEYDDNPSIYRRYRTANSDDEEFDVNEFDEGADDADYRKYMYDYIGDDDDDD